MEPWMSWAAIGVIGFAGYFYYSGKTPQDLIRSVQVDKEQPHVLKRSPEKQNRRRKGADTSSAQVGSSSGHEPAKSAASSSAASKKRKSAAAAAAPEIAAAAPVPATPAASEDVDEAYGDKEWAKQLEARKKGVSLARAAGPSNVGKTQPTKGDAKKPQTNGTTASVPGEREARSAETSGAGDVTDMLPASAPGPSTLRITGEEKAKKLIAPRSEPAKESKKQRQNRRKAEEQKAQREEDEKRRQLQLEQQRRTAREARGEPAKNGIPASKPQTSAWSSAAQAGTNSGASGVVSALANNPTQLLDTFEQDAGSTTSSVEQHTNVTTPATVASLSYEQDLPSEDAQLEMLSETSAWNEVPSKKKKAKAAREASPRRTENHAIVAPIEPPKVKPRAPVAAPPAGPQANGYAVLRQVGHPDDSEWTA